jgi:hypothetical protein
MIAGPENRAFPIDPLLYQCVCQRGKAVLLIVAARYATAIAPHDKAQFGHPHRMLKPVNPVQLFG